MFIRKKKNRSGTTSVVVVDKSSGKFTELRTIGVASTEEEIRILVAHGKDWIAQFGGQQLIDFEHKEEFRKEQEKISAEQFLSNIVKTSLGLLVSRGGYPLSYSLFNGSQYEGYAMIPIVDDFVQRFNLGKDFIVIADAGLMNARNVQLLRDGGYKYIIGARIKKESGSLKEAIISTEHKDGTFKDILCSDGDRMIAGYSDERAKENAYDRQQGIERLRRRYAKGILTKADINKRGYNKFLTISSEVYVHIDEVKIAEDSVWDGLKGYKTNTSLSAEEVYEEYQNLWNVERSFRITKGTLEVRPMFHFTVRRIEAHVCICFVALKVYKELERLLKVSHSRFSVDDVIKIAETIVILDIARPENNDTISKTLCITEEEKAIAYLIDTDDWINL